MTPSNREPQFWIKLISFEIIEQYSDCQGVDTESDMRNIIALLLGLQLKPHG